MLASANSRTNDSAAPSNLRPGPEYALGRLRAGLPFIFGVILRAIHMGVSKIGGTLVRGPLNKDPTI